MNKNGKKEQDYSQLINPRIKPNIDIVAAEEDDTLDLGDETFENNRARSLKLEGEEDKMIPTVGKVEMGHGNDEVVVLPVANTKPIKGTVESR